MALNDSSFLLLRGGSQKSCEATVLSVMGCNYYVCDAYFQFNRSDTSSRGNLAEVIPAVGGNLTEVIPAVGGNLTKVIPAVGGI